MASPTYEQPSVWSAVELAADREQSVERFVTQRKTADAQAWAAQVAEIRALVLDVLDSTNNLRNISAEALLAEEHRWHVLRYCCGPPVSEEDLWTYVGGPTFKKVPPAFAEETADVFRMFVDVVRFPWVADRRDPTPAERAEAVAATTMPLAQQRFATNNRGSASQRQEGAVALVLAKAGLVHDENKTDIWVLDEMDRGSFSRERKLAGSKCDLPVRLNDGRILAIECKSSNGPKNSWKRLQREVMGKADAWQGAFGLQVVTAAVLAGKFDLAVLRLAQDKKVAIFWEHNLTALTDFMAKV